MGHGMLFFFVRGPGEKKEDEGRTDHVSRNEAIQQIGAFVHGVVGKRREREATAQKRIDFLSSLFS